MVHFFPLSFHSFFSHRLLTFLNILLILALNSSSRCFPTLRVGITLLTVVLLPKKPVHPVPKQLIPRCHARHVVLNSPLLDRTHTLTSDQFNPGFSFVLGLWILYIFKVG